MKGLTLVVLRELQQGIPVNEIAKKYNLSQSAVYKTANKHNVKIDSKCLSEEEKKARKKQTDADYHMRQKQLQREKDYTYERPDIPMPNLPYVASRMSGINTCNLSWVFSQATKRSSLRENIKIQRKFGLH